MGNPALFVDCLEEFEGFGGVEDLDCSNGKS
jgi:hypothetical protein